MSAFSLRLAEPWEAHPLRCGAFRRQNKRSNQKSTHKVTCEKEALHSQGCLMSPVQRKMAEESDAAYSLIRVIQSEAHRHAGRDAAGKWYHWETW